MKTRARRTRERALYQQCLVCHEIVDGPYAGANPGRQVTHWHGVPITHGYWHAERGEGPEHDEQHKEEMRQRYGARYGG